MTKDEVLAAINRGAEVSQENLYFKTCALLDDALEEVTALYARLARVEALADEWTKRGSKSSYDLNHRTNELRAALKGE